MKRKLIIGFTVLFALVMISNLIPSVRGDGGWQWAYTVPGNSTGVLIFPLMCACYLLGVYGLRQQKSWLRIAWTIIWGTLLLYGSMSIRGDAIYYLFVHTVNPTIIGAANVANHFMPDGIMTNALSNWLDVMRQSHSFGFIHYTTSPPGQAMIHAFVSQMLEGTQFADTVSYFVRPFQCANVGIMSFTNSELASVALIAYIMPFVASLGAIPVFFSVRRLTHSSELACQVIAWYALLPTLMLFAPSWNIIYPVFVGASLLFLLYGLPLYADEKIRPVYLILSGLMISLNTFLNFAVLPALLIFGLLTLVIVGLWRGIIVGFWYGIGLSSCWIVYWVVAGLTPFDIWEVTYINHKYFATRDYLTWLIIHPYDTLLFMGWPMVSLFFLAIWQAIQKRKNLTPIERLTLVMLVSFTLVNLVGIVQGENGRILSFYAPFILVSIAVVLKQYDTEWHLPLLGAQSFLILVMSSFLITMGIHLKDPPSAPLTRFEHLQGEMQSLSQGFSGGDRLGEALLVGYRYDVHPEEQAIRLETLWQGIERFERPYQFEVTAYTENSIDGEIITAPQYWYAQERTYLPTCWRNEDLITDIQTFHLPDVSLPSVWDLELRMVDAKTQEALTDTAYLTGINYP